MYTLFGGFATHELLTIRTLSAPTDYSEPMSVTALNLGHFWCSLMHEPGVVFFRGWWPIHFFLESGLCYCDLVASLHFLINLTAHPHNFELIMEIRNYQGRLPAPLRLGGRTCLYASSLRPALHTVNIYRALSGMPAPKSGAALAAPMALALIINGGLRVNLACLFPLITFFIDHRNAGSLNVISALW